MSCRPHYLYVWYAGRKWILLLALPLLRALLLGQSGTQLLWNSAQDVMLAVFLVAIAWKRWRTTGYTLHGGLRIRQQFLWRHRVWVLSEDAASMEIERTPLMALTGCRRVTIFTAGVRRRADASVLISGAQAALLLHSQPNAEGEPCVGGGAVWLMALSGSNAAVGVLTLAPVVRQAARLFRTETAQITGFMGRIVSGELPMLLHTVAFLLVGGWGYAVLRQWMRFYHFRVRRHGGMLLLRSGLTTRRDVHIDCEKITTLELRQNLLMYFLRLYTATITAAGYGRERGIRPVLVPAAGKRTLCTLLDRFLPGFPLCGKRDSPLLCALRRELLFPLLLLVGFCFLWILYPNMLFLWAAAGCVWWVTVRLIGFLKGGFGADRHAVSLVYARGLGIYEVHIPLSAADSIKLTQSPFQRRHGLCSITVCTYGEKHRRHRVRGMPYEEIRKMAELFAKSSPETA